MSAIAAALLAVFVAVAVAERRRYQHETMAARRRRDVRRRHIRLAQVMAAPTVWLPVYEPGLPPAQDPWSHVPVVVTR